MPQSDQLWLQKHARTFLQPGGTSPANPLLFYGIDTDFCAIGDVTIPQGSQAPVNLWDPRTINRYLLQGRTSTPPGLATGDIMLYEKLGTVTRWLDQSPCDVTAYVGLSNCKDPSDFGNGWNGYVLVLPSGHVETVKISARNSLPAGDATLEDTLSVQWGNPYLVGPLAFGARAASTFATEVNDQVYGSDLQCGQCGVNDDGTAWIYSVLANSGAAVPSFAYSVDYGATFTASTVASATISEAFKAIDKVGNNIILLQKTAGGNGAYYYTTFNALTGVPITTFTKVSTGFVAAKTPNDMWAVSANEVWMVGDAGYIYKLTSIGSAVTVSDAGGATVQNLNRIMKGPSGTLVAVGAAGAVVYSLNNGANWAAATVVGAVGLAGIAVKSPYEWWVIDTAGLVSYTLNQGQTWTNVTMPGSFTTGKDIVFATNEVGYALGQTTAPLGILAVTFNGGANWYGANTSRILGALPSFITADRLAIPRKGVPGVAANNLLIGGVLTGTTGTLIAGGTAKF